MKQVFSKTIVMCATIALLSCGGSQAMAENVLMIDAPPGGAAWSNDVISKIDAAGFSGTITEFNGGAGTPSLATMQSYDAVFIYSDIGFQDPTLMGNNLAAYVNGGGGVVVATFSNASEPLGGLWASGQYDPILPAGQTEGIDLHLGQVLIPNDPLLNNVTSFDGGSNSYHGTGVVNPNAQLIANWSDGSPLLARLTTFAGRIDSLNFYPVSSDQRGDFWSSNTDGGIIMANALEDVGNQSVPEPSTLALLGLGGLALSIRAIRRKRISA